MTTVTLWFIFNFHACKITKTLVVTSIADHNAKYYHQNKTWIEEYLNLIVDARCDIKCIHILCHTSNYKVEYRKVLNPHYISHHLGTLRKPKLSSHIQSKEQLLSDK